ncbi:MAG: hypothetical protein V1740_04770 [Candidatus Woesearchaeota archaeon]
MAEKESKKKGKPTTGPKKTGKTREQKDRTRDEKARAKQYLERTSGNIPYKPIGGHKEYEEYKPGSKEYVKAWREESQTDWAGAYARIEKKRKKEQAEDEKKKRAEEKEQKTIDELVTEQTYGQIKKAYADERANAPEASAREKRKGFMRNILNITKNAYYNTVGNLMAQSQNERTRRSIRANPEGKEKLVILKPGIYQTIGSQAALGRKLIRKGYLVYHVPGDHHLTLDQNTDRTFEHIEDLFTDPMSNRGKGSKKKKVGPYREIILTGHSSGANVFAYLAGDKRVHDYNIKKVQARAIAATGIGEKPTLGQRLLLPLAEGDNPKTKRGRENIIYMHRRKPLIPVQVVVGKYDDLVPPRDGIYKYASNHYLIDHPDSTHFGTSGVNDTMNDVFVNLLEREEKYRERVVSGKPKRKAA